MRVLIVEDNAFNAFCLRRLLESVLGTSCVITVVDNSHAALTLIYRSSAPDLIIIDGQLGAPDSGGYCNSPELANILLYKYPELPIVVWSDEDEVRREFMRVFQAHDRLIQDCYFWNKTVDLDFISSIWTQCIGLPHTDYARTVVAH
jgi:DNA-binding NarL/FixJ family response regulator